MNDADRIRNGEIIAALEQRNHVRSRKTAIKLTVSGILMIAYSIAIISVVSCSPNLFTSNPWLLVVAPTIWCVSLASVVFQYWHSSNRDFKLTECMLERLNPDVKRIGSNHKYLLETAIGTILFLIGLMPTFPVLTMLGAPWFIALPIACSIIAFSLLLMLHAYIKAGQENR